MTESTAPKVIAGVRLEDRPQGVAVICKKCNEELGVVPTAHAAYSNVSRWLEHECGEAKSPVAL